MPLNMTPFVKWAGGKKQLLERLKERMPDSYNRYFEPFIGGGALLLGIQPNDAVINDVNKQLLNVYKQLQKNAEMVITEVKKYDSITCDKEIYYEARDKYNRMILESQFDAVSAALTIWINKHCFNGLYRVNKKGLFNVPYNNKIAGTSMNEDNLRNIGNYLKDNNVQIMQGDFENACADAKAGDFVYFDSPYIPVSRTADFTDYTKDGFTYEDHCRLAALYERLSDAGVKVMLSNHNVDLVHELYSKYTIEAVSVKRAINSDATKRVGKEVIITNYRK